MSNRNVVFQPITTQGLQRGINLLVGAIRPTLGPRSRMVAIDQMFTKKPPELLDSGGVIARRIIELQGRDADMGAMLVRGMVCRLHEQVGDGAATAAVLFQAIYREGIRYIAAGYNASRLRGYLRQAAEVAVSELGCMTIPFEGRPMLTHIAQSLCADPELAKMLSEIFDIIGEFGQLEIRQGRGRRLERSYLEGMDWESGLFSREMITDRVRLRTDFENAAILISDLHIEHAYELLPVIEMATGSQITPLVVIARHFSEEALGTLYVANRYPEKLQIIAVKTPGGNNEDRNAALEDLAILTGGMPLLEAGGYSFKSAKPEILGSVRRLWATSTHFGIAGGRGDARLLRKHISALQAHFKREETVETRRKIQQRIGKLMGGSATLIIGGATEEEITVRQETAQRVADSLRGAVLDGVLPGGGIALLACRPKLAQKLAQSADPDEQAAYRILIRALSEPARIIVSNAGYDDNEILARIELAEAGCGFDVVSGQLVNMAAAGIFDVAAIQKQVIYSAITTAALALTVDVLVHHKNPEKAADPG